MDITYDAAKNDKNIADRGLSFELVHGFDWNTALVVEDTRNDYSEARFQALGKIEGRLHTVVFTLRGDSLRIISLRKANAREVARYEKAWPEKARPRTDRPRKPGMDRGHLPPRQAGVRSTTCFGAGEARHPAARPAKSAYKADG